MKCNGTNTPLEIHAMQLFCDHSLMQKQASNHALHSSLNLCIEELEGFNTIQQDIEK